MRNRTRNAHFPRFLQIFADFRGSLCKSRDRFAQKTAGHRRFPQETAENCRFLQKNRFLPFAVSLLARSYNPFRDHMTGRLGHRTMEMIGSGVAPANQTKERPVHELFAGAFRNKSSICEFRACFPKEKHQNSQKWVKFMNFSFWPFLFFGLPGRPLNWRKFRVVLRSHALRPLIFYQNTVQGRVRAKMAKFGKKRIFHHFCCIGFFVAGHAEVVCIIVAYAIFWGSVCHVFCRNPFILTDFYAMRTPIVWHILGAYFLQIWGVGVVRNIGESKLQSRFSPDFFDFQNSS